jgi:hypothetical protein
MVEQVVRGHDCLHEPDASGLVGVDCAARQQQIQRGWDAHQPGQKPRQPVLGDEPQPRERGRHRRAPRGETDAAADHVGEPDPGDGPVDRRNDWRLQVQRRLRQIFRGGHEVRQRIGTAAEDAQIGARAESPSRTGDDDRPHIRVVIGGTQ